MRKLQYAAISLASILSLTFLGSCSKDTEYVDRIITETDTLYVEKIITDTVSAPTDTTLSIGEGIDPTPRKKVPLTIISYGVGGGNLDTYLNTCYLNGLEYFASWSNQTVTLGEDINFVGQYKFSSPDSLINNSYLPDSIANKLGGNTYRFVFDTRGILEYRNWYDKTATGKFSSIYKYADVVSNDASYAMNSTDNLIEFLNYAASVAPADKYILVLEDHGGGYGFDNNKTRAVLYDDNRDYSALTTPQIRKGIMASDIKQVEAIIFNA